MSIIGSSVSVIDANDPTKKGRKGEIVMETTNTVLLRTAEGTITIEKAGTVLAVEGEAEPLSGDEVIGRLEDRIRAGKR